MKLLIQLFSNTNEVSPRSNSTKYTFHLISLISVDELYYHATPLFLNLRISIVHIDVLQLPDTFNYQDSTAIIPNTIYMPVRRTGRAARETLKTLVPVNSLPAGNNKTQKETRGRPVNAESLHRIADIPCRNVRADREGRYRNHVVPDSTASPRIPAIATAETLRAYN